MTCVASFPLVLFSLGPAPAQSSVDFPPEAVGTFPAFTRPICHGDEFTMDGFIPKPFSSRGPRRLELCAYPPYPLFSTLFLKALKIVLVSFAAWTSNCMKCNNSHFRLKKKQKTPCVTLCSSLQWITLGNPTNDFFFSAKPE